MTRAVRHLFERFERVIRYLLVGGGVTLVYTTLTVALISSGIIPDPTVASACATIVTQPFAFVIHQAITYADVEPEASHWKRFALVAASTFVLTTGTMKLVDSLGWPFWIGLAIGWVVIPVTNYLIGAVWVFRARKLTSMTRDR